MNALNSLIPLVCLLAFSSIAADTAAPATTTDGATGVAAKSSVAGRLKSLSATGYVADDKYRLRAGDKVSFQVLEDRLFDDKDMPKPLVVADSGELDVPYIGRVEAVNKTCKQVGEDIKVALEKEYYKQATVVLAVDVANKYLGRVYVWGQVRTQGPIEVAVNEKITAGKAILRAGGFGDFANKKRVKVIRAANAAGEKESFELNMVDILENGRTEKDLQLQPDDYILVPSRLINF